jgi:low affinity Fe/Cu permease
MEVGMHTWFARMATRISGLTGSAWSFALAMLVILVWAVSGPLFRFSDTWQLVINTGTTIVTFLMVFLIQNTQNRDTRAMHLKLDELLRAVRGARQDRFVDLEDRDEVELEQIKQEVLQECGVCLSREEHRRHPHHARRPDGKSRTQPRAAVAGH